MHNFDPAYAHNDVKPGNVLITHRRGQPPLAILMDFGSARPARRQIRSRSEALQLQVLFLPLSSFLFDICDVTGVLTNLYDITKTDILNCFLNPLFLVPNVLNVYCIFCTLVITLPASCLYLCHFD